jgi:hypothetical protein
MPSPVEVPFRNAHLIGAERQQMVPAAPHESKGRRPPDLYSGGFANPPVAAADLRGPVNAILPDRGLS